MNQGWRIEETSPDLSGVLARFFAQCDGIVGTEANYQALLAIELEKAYPGRVRREHKLPEAGRGGLDVVVLDAAGEAEYVFELKGGAYNTRNALQDVFDVDGVCSDMLRLARLRVPPNKRWLVAVDAIELGRSLRYPQQKRAASAARSMNTSFAYFGHGDDAFLMAEADGKNRFPEVGHSLSDSGKQADVQEVLRGDQLQRALRGAAGSVAMEADLVSTIYRAFRDSGCAANQLALETYFGFAPGNMHQRPDICVFDPEIDGHFNLYPRGDSRKSYDSLKLANLRLLIEVKGGLPLIKRRDATLANVYLGDIEKMARWRSVVEQAGKKLGVDRAAPSFLVVGADMRVNSLEPATLQELNRKADQLGIDFMYVHMPIGR